MDKKDLTKKKNIDSENIDTYQNLGNLRGTTANNYDVGNNIINEENKKLYGNNSNLYSNDYVPSKNDIDNVTGYENKRFNENRDYSTENIRNNVTSNANNISMDSVLRDSIHNPINNQEPSKSRESKRWVYNSDRKGTY